MSEINQELELYKLVTNQQSECGWINDTEFYIWLSYYEMADFMEKFSKIFGKCIFDDGGIEAHLMSDYICLDLTNALSGTDIDFEIVFPREEFKH